MHFMMIMMMLAFTNFLRLCIFKNYLLFNHFIMEFMLLVFSSLIYKRREYWYMIDSSGVFKDFLIRIFFSHLPKGGIYLYMLGLDSSGNFGFRFKWKFQRLLTPCDWCGIYTSIFYCTQYVSFHISISMITPNVCYLKNYYTKCMLFQQISNDYTQCVLF
jgi:hypothetical protein